MYEDDPMYDPYNFRITFKDWGALLAIPVILIPWCLGMYDIIEWIAG